MVDDRKIERMEQKQDRQRNKTKRKTEEHAAMGAVFDKYTVDNLNKLITKGVVKEFVGILSAGKEANVYFAYGEDSQPLAIKIYKIDPQNTKWMKNYIIGDPRFKKIGNTTHKIIYTWAKKEFKNLKEMERHNIIVPRPLSCVDNLLVMEFIGDEDGTPAPRLKDVREIDDPESLLNTILDQIRKIYIKAHLVHGDLSEYNILIKNDLPVIIDVSQAVSILHINAPIFLARDVKNVIKFFDQYIPTEKLPIAADIVQEILHTPIE